MSKYTPEEIARIREWAAGEFICKCGFKTTFGKKKTHVNNELCLLLQNNKYGTVSGTDKVICHHCKKEITVCGLSAHYKANHPCQKKDITQLFKN